MVGIPPANKILRPVYTSSSLSYLYNTLSSLSAQRSYGPLPSLFGICLTMGNINEPDDRQELRRTLIWITRAIRRMQNGHNLGLKTLHKYKILVLLLDLKAIRL